ncbi:MAG: hypothetical protein B7Z69_04115 [Actinobacteria bacterium 21-73-9]|nr:MAG: hypothetical protein B7Z69_04115 [Actinobacteria bacterium 21-73-9]
MVDLSSGVGSDRPASIVFSLERPPVLKNRETGAAARTKVFGEDEQGDHHCISHLRVVEDGSGGTAPRQ